MFILTRQNWSNSLFQSKIFINNLYNSKTSSCTNLLLTSLHSSGGIYSQEMLSRESCFIFWFSNAWPVLLILFSIFKRNRCYSSSDVEVTVGDRNLRLTWSVDMEYCVIIELRFMALKDYLEFLSSKNLFYRWEKWACPDNH